MLTRYNPINKKKHGVLSRDMKAKYDKEARGQFINTTSPKISRNRKKALLLKTQNRI
ncbi:hypothetical protein Cpin_0747 [Chitinophaga pinensis DSM 2588]|uniref:Uncharacterized protein n=1 Tax=Chitinophaga pinensis (strain ATCC 43595 / DSM 2588 / LMG 13176 / NBRC 15968 / NCIMB 11800 / UQM 2034) TaxID=485918 RepID=A0A979FZU5_CHIPD|nr:hypothetical protein Cpin_0747 [Chitinophaga pinensis DSM 2588]